jgi:hypothetical protein
MGMSIGTRHWCCRPTWRPKYLTLPRDGGRRLYRFIEGGTRNHRRIVDGRGQ